jgi:hypothetical protein
MNKYTIYIIKQLAACFISIFIVSCEASNIFIIHNKNNNEIYSTDRYITALILFEKISMLEQNKQYYDLYEILSSSMKERLRTLYDIHNKYQYYMFRLSSESKWSDFQLIDAIFQSNNSLIMKVHAKVEESGEIEHVNSLYTFIMEHHAWKLDDWKY